MIKSVGKTNGYQTNNMIHANKRPPKTINQNTKRNTISYSHIEKRKNTNPQETTQKKERKRKQRNLPSGLCWNNGLEAIFDWLRLCSRRTGSLFLSLSLSVTSTEFEY